MQQHLLRKYLAILLRKLKKFLDRHPKFPKYEAPEVSHALDVICRRWGGVLWEVSQAGTGAGRDLQEVVGSSLWRFGLWRSVVDGGGRVPWRSVVDEYR